MSLFIGVGFIWYQNGKDIQEDYYSDTFMQHRIYTSLYGSADELRDSLHSSDLSEFIYLAQKSTPDYLPNLEEKSGPATNEETHKAYHAYHDQIILPNNNFEKQVKGNQLVITWTAKEAEETAVPIIVYQDSQLVLNHQVLNREDIKLSTIGVPTVTSQKGQNTLVLSYKQQWWLLPVIAISLMGWGLWLCYYMAFYRKSKLST